MAVAGWSRQDSSNRARNKVERFVGMGAGDRFGQSLRRRVVAAHAYELQGCLFARASEVDAAVVVECSADAARQISSVDFGAGACKTLDGFGRGTGDALVRAVDVNAFVPEAEQRHGYSCHAGRREPWASPNDDWAVREAPDDKNEPDDSDRKRSEDRPVERNIKPRCEHVDGLGHLGSYAGESGKPVKPDREQCDGKDRKRKPIQKIFT